MAFQFVPLLTFLALVLLSVWQSLKNLKVNSTENIRQLKTNIGK